MKTTRTLSIATIVVLMAGVVQAATIDWDRGGADTEWNTTNNWETAYLPGATTSDTVRIIAADVVTVSSAVTSSNSVKLIVRNASVNTSLSIGADIDSLSQIDLAVSSGGAGTTSTVVQIAGTVTVSGSVNIGGDAADRLGTYKQTGGLLNASGIVVQVGGTYDQSGGSVTTEVLTVNAGGVYTLNDGTLTVGAGSSTHELFGDLVIDGGTLTLNKNDDIDPDSDDITINGGGTATLLSGTLNSLGDDGSEVTTFKPNLVIRGGTVDLTGQNKFNRGITVIGSDATIGIDRLNQAGSDFVFEFDALDGSAGTRLSTITNNTYIHLGDATVTVDASGYQGLDAEIFLFASTGNSGLLSTSSVVNVTGLSDFYAARIVQNQTEDWVKLVIDVQGITIIIR